jgi:predicted RND superfamily exporter protein
MADKLSQWYADTVTTYSKTVILVVLVMTGVVAAGIALGGSGEQDLGGFEVDSEETKAQDFVLENYGENDGVVAQVVVRNESGDVLTRDSLLDGLRLQQAVRNNQTLNQTLSSQGFLGLENVVATIAVYQDRGLLGGPPGGEDGNQSGPPSGEDGGDGAGPQAGGQPPTSQPSLSAQIEALEERDDQEVEELLRMVLDPDSDVLGDQDPYNFLPTKNYNPGETDANARLVLVTQVDDSGENAEPTAAYDAQVAIDGMVDERFDDAFVFGQGVRDDASSRATGDSFAIITPFALLLIILVLGITYRDLLDIALAFVGIFMVLIWYQGIQSWLAIPMNVILIAVPFLLIGLSIDYALHVVMRSREARGGKLRADQEADEDIENRGIRTAMAVGFGSVVLALGAATVSTAIGFISNVVSPLPAIRDFAILSAAGIVATFIAFGLFLPALKVEFDGFIENRLGRSRKKSAFGVDSGFVNAVLERLASVTGTAPAVIVILALVVGSAGAFGATTIDTEFNQADFLPEDAPDWAEYLPGPLEPGTYTISADFQYLSENFALQRGGGQSQILIRANGTDSSVTDPSLLETLDEAGNDVPEGSSIQTGADGQASVEGPHTAIRDVAAENETFAGLVEDNDENGDGLPDENVSAVYDALFDADEETASQYLSRDDSGAVTSARLQLSVTETESAQTIAEDTRTYAGDIEAETGGITAVATGATVTTAVVQDALLETLVEAFAVTLVVILAFLTVLFYVRYRSLSLGAVVLAPVVVSLAWLLGAMSLLGIAFNSETAVITSLAIGLGVDYSIHAGERFVDEREKRETVDEALTSALTGTGGTLLGSAATTAAAFGVLAFALSPPLQRFGIVTGMAIIFAFVAVVTLLPSLLVLRERALDRWAAR